MTDARAECVQGGSNRNGQYRSKNQQRDPGDRRQREESAHPSMVSRLSSRRGRLAVGGCLRLRDLVTRLGAGAHVRLVDSDEDATETAVALRIARRVAERILA